MIDKIRRILEHSYQTVPYYNDIFQKNNILIDRIKSLEDYQMIPMLDKEKILDQYDSFISNSYDKNDLVVEHTSGTTGIPLNIYKTRSDKVLQGHVMWKTRNRIYGVTPDSRYCTWHIKGPSIYNVGNRLQFSCIMMNDECLEQYSTAIIKHQPEWLFGGAETWLILAEYMKKRGFIPPRSIKFIESTGGQLRKDTAKYLSEFFECSVDDMYGCIEMYGIARSKGMSELKVLEDNVYLEIVDENGKRVPDGTYGSILLTSLNSYAMPFIRYRIGDIGRLIAYADKGGDKKYLELKKTRINERIITDTNENVDADIFHCAIERLNRNKSYTILQYKVIQKTISKFDVYLRLNDDKNEIRETVKNDFLNEIVLYGLTGCEWDIKFVDRLEINQLTGKYQYFVQMGEKQNEIL